MCETAKCSTHPLAVCCETCHGTSLDKHHHICVLTLFVAASISRQEEHRGTREFECSGLLGVHALSIQVEPIRWVLSGNTTRQSHTLSTQHTHTHTDKEMMKPIFTFHADLSLPDLFIWCISLEVWLSMINYN